MKCKVEIEKGIPEYFDGYVEPNEGSIVLFQYKDEPELVAVFDKDYFHFTNEDHEGCIRCDLKEPNNIKWRYLLPGERVIITGLEQR